MLLESTTVSPCIDVRAERVRPIKKKILVRKCLGYEAEEHEGRIWYKADNIVVTDVRGTYTHWAEILDVSDDCELFTKEHIGAFVNLPEWNPQNMSKVSHKLENGVPVDDFIVKEKLFLMPNGAKPIIAR
jgi:hypothetical protein